MFYYQYCYYYASKILSFNFIATVVSFTWFLFLALWSSLLLYYWYVYFFNIFIIGFHSVYFFQTWPEKSFSQVEDLLETTSLPCTDRVKVCVHLTPQKLCTKVSFQLMLQLGVFPVISPFELRLIVLQICSQKLLQMRKILHIN